MGLKPLQILDEVTFLVGRQLQIEMLVVVIHDRLERGKPSVVIKPALLTRKQTP